MNFQIVQTRQISVAFSYSLFCRCAAYPPFFSSLAQAGSQDWGKIHNKAKKGIDFKKIPDYGPPHHLIETD